MKPRDAIVFLNYCIREAAGSERMTWNDIYKAELRYSEFAFKCLEG